MKDLWKDVNEVKIRVKKIKGVCSAGHNVGDEWIVQKTTPPNFCGSAYCTLYPDLRTLIFGGKLPWEKDGEINVTCSDSINCVVFGLKVIKKEEVDC